MCIPGSWGYQVAAWPWPVIQPGLSLLTSFCLRVSLFFFFSWTPWEAPGCPGWVLQFPSLVKWSRWPRDMVLLAETQNAECDLQPGQDLSISLPLERPFPLEISIRKTRTRQGEMLNSSLLGVIFGLSYTEGFSWMVQVHLLRCRMGFVIPSTQMKASWRSF